MCCSAVGITTHCELDVPGIEPRWKRFSATVWTVPGDHPASCKMGTGSYPGAKRPRRGVDHPTPSSAEVKERIVFYLYFPFWPSRPVIGWRYMSSGISSRVALVKILTIRHGVTSQTTLIFNTQNTSSERAFHKKSTMSTDVFKMCMPLNWTSFIGFM